jgi:hypothetical protein
MVKSITSIFILLIISSHATAESYISLFADEQGTRCHTDLILGQPLILHVIAVLDEPITALTAAEFRIRNWPTETGPTSGYILETWNTDLTMGDIEWGKSLAFDSPLPGPLAHLGTIQIMANSNDWLGADYEFIVSFSYVAENLVIIDENFETFEVAGGTFTFNCSTPGQCECLESVAVQKVSWGSLKALY